MELRQLRYFVTLAEELHFGRAAAREHIVQSALSQQLQRLERELGVRLLARSTHHVSLTAAGAAFLAEARQILAHTDRAAAVARSAAAASAPLRVGIIDASYDSMPQILHEVQARYPSLVIHQVEASVPEQYQQLADGRLDVGIGRAANAPPRSPRTCSAMTRWASWSRPATGSPPWTPSRSPSWPKSHCCSPRRSGPRNSTSSPSEMCRRRLRPHRARGHRGKRPRGRQPGTPRRCLYCVPRPASPRSPGPPGGLSPNQPPTTRGRCWARQRHLRPRARHRQLRTNHVPPPRLARHPRPDRAPTGPNTVRPVVTPLRRAAAQSVRSQTPFAHGLKGAGRATVDASARIMSTL